MQYEPTTETPVAPTGTNDTFKDKLHDKTETVKQSVASASGAIRKETSHLCDCACDGIRKSPLASVAGAAFFGAAVCYLILEGRRQASFSERYIHRPLSDVGSTVSDSCHSLFGNLKFW